MVCGVIDEPLLTYLLKRNYMKNPYHQIGQRIKAIRKSLNLTQAQLAEKAGVSDNFIGLIERGEGRPTLDTVAKIAEALRIKLQDLFIEDSVLSTKEIIHEIENLLKSREAKDAELVLSISKKVFEYFPSKAKSSK